MHFPDFPKNTFRHVGNTFIFQNTHSPTSH